VSAPSYGALEEDVSVHMQALRLGEIVLTMCSCEQWADQARNIKTRTDTVRDNQYMGYRWADRCEPAGGQWSCVNPQNESQRLTISDALYKKMRAQVANDAVGWDSLANVPTAESEPVDPAAIKGNYTHEELAPANGYALTVPLGMVNDYNGYIATYREYQRGDHYRKALTAWGPHSSDYFATRLTQLAGHLKSPDAQVLPTEDTREAHACGLPVDRGRRRHHGRADQHLTLGLRRLVAAWRDGGSRRLPRDAVLVLLPRRLLPPGQVLPAPGRLRPRREQPDRRVRAPADRRRSQA
jgi:hypothetical protein